MREQLQAKEQGVPEAVFSRVLKRAIPLGLVQRFFAW